MPGKKSSTTEVKQHTHTHRTAIGATDKSIIVNEHEWFTFQWHHEKHAMQILCINKTACIHHLIMYTKYHNHHMYIYVCGYLSVVQSAVYLEWYTHKLTTAKLKLNGHTTAIQYQDTTGYVCRDSKA